MPILIMYYQLSSRILKNRKSKKAKCNFMSAMKNAVNILDKTLFVHVHEDLTKLRSEYITNHNMESFRASWSNRFCFYNSSY